MRPPNPLPPSAVLLAGATLTLCSLSCGDDFTPFNEIDRLRVLAISADPPWLVPTSSAALPSTTLSALVVNGPEVTGPAARLEWSWCPLRAGSTGQGEVGPYECVFGPAELNEMLGLDTTDLPDEFPLGTSDTVELVYPLPPEQVQGICDMLAAAELPEFVDVPTCENGFPISVRLIARQGEEEVVSLKEVLLAYEEGAPTNAVPRLGQLVARDPANPTTTIELVEGSTTALKRDVPYEFEVAYPQSTSEMFRVVPAPCINERDANERILVSWFIEGGETDSVRTGWLVDSFWNRDTMAEEAMEQPDREDGKKNCVWTFDDAGAAEAYERARKNIWTTPKAVDFPGEEANLYLVVRDGRQGTTFISRRVRLED